MNCEASPGLIYAAADAVQALALEHPDGVEGSPVRRAKRMMDGRNVRGVFEAALWLHLEWGHTVINTTEVFCLARPVEREAEAHILRDLTHRFARPNAWYIYCLAGRTGRGVHAMAAALLAMPYLLEFVGFSRRGGAPRWQRTFWLRRRIYERYNRLKHQ